MLAEWINKFAGYLFYLYIAAFCSTTVYVSALKFPGCQKLTVYFRQQKIIQDMVDREKKKENKSIEYLVTHQAPPPVEL